MKSKFIFMVIIVVAYSDPTEDIVTLAFPEYKHTWYSGTQQLTKGYLQFNTGSFHYVFFPSQKDPSNDPLNWWFNGGPGCSSMMGMLYGNGPFVFQADSFNLKINQWSWNRQSNVLYVTTPGGVGFSQSFRNNNLTYSDETTTEDNLKALLKFYQKFPTMKKNQLYLTGQSYAGVYIPFLAKAILDYNKLPSKTLSINLKGIMVNNACTDQKQCYSSRLVKSNTLQQYEYLYNHGFYAQKQYTDTLAACFLGYNSEHCAYLRKSLDQKLPPLNISLSNIYLPCYYQTIANNDFLIQTGENKLSATVSCDDSKGMLSFLNQPEMHVYLHVKNQVFKNCNDEVASKYIKNPNQSYPLYKQLINSKLRIWIVSGDHDGLVPYTGTLSWINKLRQQVVMPVQYPWREWWIKGLHKNQDQVAGMTWGLRGLKFTTIKGAGHSAHKDKKQQSWVLVDSFLKGNQLPQKQE